VVLGVDGIEQSRALLTTASPGSKIGVLLGDGAAADMLRGRTVQFAPAAQAGPGARSPQI
jgi:hypothetical protein